MSPDYTRARWVNIISQVIFSGCNGIRRETNGVVELQKMLVN